jgi:hypothetical protein
MPRRVRNIEALEGRRRRRILLGGSLTVIVILVFAGGWFAADVFESPAQRAASAKAPLPSAITAAVSQGDLSQVISAKAEMSRAAQQHVALQAAGSLAVVTGQPTAAGSRVDPGTVVAEVNGRPVIALPGVFRFYRDLTRGDAGPDVAQLQRGLTAAGHSVSADGVFGVGTTRALEALYEAAAYSAPTAAAPDGTTGTAVTTPSPGSAATTTPDAAPAAPQVTLDRLEFVVVGALPGFLVSSLAVNTELSDTSEVVIEEGAIVGVAEIASSVAVNLAPKMKGVMTGADGVNVPVVVSSVGTPAKAGDPVPVVLSGDGTTLPETWLRTSALAVITIETAAKDSLLVPSAAVVTSGRTNAFVLKRLPDGTYSEITVEEVGRLAGRSAVIPKKAGTLRAGDSVRIR